MKKQVVKPDKATSRLTFFIGILFSIFGVAFLFMTILSPISIMMAPFALMFTAISIFNTVKAYKNGFTEEGSPIYEINTYEDNSDNNFDVKLRKLEELKKDGLITESEYSKKRTEIMNKEW